MTYQLYVREWGAAGPPAVLLHGLGASASFWRPTAEALGNGLRVIAPDLLGFGRSPWPSDAAYSPKEHLDALELVAAATRDGQPALLVGHSLGAILALAWAARRPRWFSSLILMGLPAFESAAAARSHIISLSPLSRIAIGHPRLGAALSAVMCRTRPFWRGVAPFLGLGFPADVARDWVLHDWRSYSGTMERCVFGVSLHRLVERVARQGVHVRVLHGDADREAPIGAVRMLTERHGWRLTVVEGGGHFLPITHADRCAELLREVSPRQHADLRKHHVDGAGEPTTLSPTTRLDDPVRPTEQHGRACADPSDVLWTVPSSVRGADTAADGRYPGRQPQEVKAD